MRRDPVIEGLADQLETGPAVEIERTDPGVAPHHRASAPDRMADQAVKDETAHAAATATFGRGHPADTPGLRELRCPRWCVGKDRADRDRRLGIELREVTHPRVVVTMEV